MFIKSLSSLLILLTACSGQVHVENDYFGFFNKNNDRNYTHGTKFSSYIDSENERQTYSLGQNIYTPAYKKASATKEQLDSSRPYTGFLAAEYRNASIKDSVKTVYGVQAGCTGNCSLAKESQTLVHNLLGQDVPTWDPNYSLKSEPGVILEGEKYYVLHGDDSSYLDIYSRGKLGNIIDSVSLGLSFKCGEGISRFEPEAITFKADLKKSDFSYYFFTEAEGRAIGYNHLLEGSLFQDERHTVEANPIVGELDLGIRVGYKNFKFSYSYTFITQEWDGQGKPFAFGNIDISW